MKRLVFNVAFVLGTAMLGAPVIMPVTPARAQGLQPISSSSLAGIKLPEGAQRVANNAVPAEVDDALAAMIKSGGAGIKRGQTEVIAWKGDVSKNRVAQFKTQIAASLKKDGWEYSEGEKIEGAGDATMVSAIKTTPPRRGLIGFFLPDKQTFLLAWTEMLPLDAADEPQLETPKANTGQSTPNGNTGVVPPTPANNGGAILEGVTMPRGGAPWNAIAEPFTGLLTALAKEKVVALPPAGRAQVWAWKGDAFRADRVKFTVTAVESTLKGAGYTITEIDSNELREVNAFEHFDISKGDLPFAPTLSGGMRNLYWKATNAAKGQTLLGAFIQGDDALALGLMPVQYKAAHVAKPLPGVGGDAVLVTNFKNVSAALPALKNPTFAPLQKKPRAVRGWAKDMSGKPLAGVEVAVHCSAGGGFRTTHKARTNAQGLYEVVLPVGVAEVVQADYKQTWNGQTFDRMLAPASGNFTQFNAQNGHVENLVLKSTGQYGANIRILHGLSEGGTIQITLAPQGTTADGAPARTLVFRYPSGIGTGETYLQFIPLAKYTISAKLLEDGEELPLRVRNTFGDDQELKASLPVKWESGYDALSGDTGESHLRAFQVVLEP
jgi:hypothetical protein